ncbi:MAG TPA: UDP-N-acetylmuramoyl-L-alanyl-D-glutamate--2,6-diaminopimelate ligase [Steroidobacteraceae bacterium]
MSTAPPQSGHYPARVLSEVVGKLAHVPADVAITDLTLDSRSVTPGAAFLACEGRSHHGLEFAAAAAQAGARVVLYEPSARARVPQLPSGIVLAPVPELARHAGEIAERFFGAPSHALTIAGITGTNGKTTCAWLLAQALGSLGRRTAYLGTLGHGIPPAIVPGVLTTSDAVSVHRELAAARAQGAECVAMEVSSHALDQERITAVRFHTAAFTNLTRDHLDYHGTMQRYGAAKARLFARQSLKAQVLNADDEFGRELARRARPGLRVVLTARTETDLPFAHAEFVRATRVSRGARGLTVEVHSSWGPGEFRVPLVGAFNVDNALTVLAIMLAWDVALPAASAALAACTAPPGRMEIFGGADAPLIVVDYAHTPDALAKALAATRDHCSGRLAVVFGCGGDRDAGKRAPMGAIAGELADTIIVTDDNPRTEEPQQITAQIVAGIAPGVPRSIVHDRALAIRTAIGAAHAGDAVLIAGKGHEDYQIVGAQRRAFSDQAVVREVLALRARETAP